MQAISPFVIFAVFDVQVLKLTPRQLYNLVMTNFDLFVIPYAYEELCLN